MATQASDTSSKTRARGSSDELAIIAQRAQAFTNASGTAIAMSEGSSDEMICRARSGATAPEVGTPMRVEGSFTGLCIQSGKELRCDDAETDTRVDTTGLRALGIRSLVATPIKEENRVIGVLMVFAPTAHAFTITHVAVLKTMADQITALLQRERKAREEGAHPPEPGRPSPPAAVPMPKAVTSTPVLPPPVVIKPSAPSVAAARTAAFPVVSKVEPIKTAPVAEEVAIQPPVIKREEKRPETKTDHRLGLGTLDALASEAKRKNNNRLMLGAVAALLVVAAAGTFAYRKMRQTTSPTAAAPRPADASNPSLTGAGQPAGATAGAPTTGAQPGLQPPGNVAVSSPTTANPVAVTGVNAAPKPSANNAVAEVSRRADKPTAATRENVPPPAKPSPTAVAVSVGTSKLGGGGDQGSSDVTPVLSVGTNDTPGALSALTRPTETSTPSRITQSELEPVAVLKRVAPIYPAIARARRLSGTVTVQVVVSKDGKATNLQFISGPPVFRDAAFDAVKQWQFRPARLNGQPIEQSEQIRVNFTP